MAKDSFRSQMETDLLAFGKTVFQQQGNCNLMMELVNKLNMTMKENVLGKKIIKIIGILEKQLK